MAQADAGDARFLGGEGVVMFQFAGYVAVGLCRDNGIDDFAARTCTDRGLFHQPVFVILCPTFCPIAGAGFEPAQHGLV